VQEPIPSHVVADGDPPRAIACNSVICAGPIDFQICWGTNGNVVIRLRRVSLSQFARSRGRRVPAKPVAQQLGRRPVSDIASRGRTGLFLSA
jgi:hypothetical protein